MTKLIVIGGGGHAKSLIAVVRKLGTHDLIGYTDKKDRGLLMCVPYLGDDVVLSEHTDCQLALGVGSLGTSEARLRILYRFRDDGFEFPTIISPQSVVSSEVEIGVGTVVFDGAVINTGTLIGEGSIINSNCTVEHDARIGKNVHVCPGATICGDVTIGDHSFVGAGATIIQGRTICAECTIGAGATVVHDCLDAGTYLGTPARRCP